MREFLWSEDMADACVFLLENRDFKDVIANEVKQSVTKETIFENEVKQTSNPLVDAISSTSVLLSTGLVEIRNTHINIGTGKEISIKDLSGLIKQTIGYKGLISFDNTKPDGTMRKLTNPSKLHDLGWKHKIELKQGIALMYKYYLNNNS
jgi:GDP-L-fucose synthase